MSALALHGVCIQPTEEPDLVVFSNHFLAVLGFPCPHGLLLQLVLTSLQLSFAFYPGARRYLVLRHVIHVCKEPLQVADSVLERIGTGAVLRILVFRGIRTLVSCLAGVWEGARLLGCDRIGGVEVCGLIVLALL